MSDFIIKLLTTAASIVVGGPESDAEGDCYEQCSFMKEYWAVTKQVADEYGLFVIPKEIKW